jgi:hypothetical protein
VNEPGAPPEAAESADERASRWEDYVDVFYLILLPANAMLMRAALAASPRAGALSDRMMMVFQVLSGIAVPLSYVVFIVFAAALLWLAGRFAEIRTDFSRTMLVATYGGFILLLSQLVSGVLVLLHGEAGLDPIRHLSLGVLRFTGDDGVARALVPLLRRLDLFAIWQAVLWAVGLHVIYRTTRFQAAITAAISWLLFAVPGLIMAALGVGQPPQA